jgi:hypothetical protein
MSRSTLVHVQVRYRHVHYIVSDAIKQKQFSVEIGVSVGLHEVRGVAESGEVLCAKDFNCCCGDKYEFTILRR